MRGWGLKKRLAGIIHGDRGLLSYVGQVSQPAVFEAGWETCPTFMNGSV